MIETMGRGSSGPCEKSCLLLSAGQLSSDQHLCLFAVYQGDFTAN